jgi:hypothetical protein
VLSLVFTLTAMLATQKAAAYSPELLLQKSLAKTPEIESASSKQFLNPFSEIRIGVQHSWGHFDSLVTRDDADRIRTRDETAISNELSLQVKPKGISEMNSYRKYEKSLNERTSLERLVLQSKGAKAAYDLLSRAAQAKEEQALLAEWNTILDRTQRLSAISARSQGDAKAVVKAASEFDKAKNEMAEISGAIAGVNYSLNRRGLAVDGLETEQILSAQEISERLSQIKDASSLSATETQAEVDLERTRLKHSEDSNSHWIDSLKFSVKKEKDNSFRQRYVPFPDSIVPTPGTFLTQDEAKKGTTFSLAINLNLPFLAARDLDEQRDRIKVARKEAEAQLESDHASERAASLRETVKEKISAYLNSTETKSNITDSLLRNDPMLAMELQRASIYRRLFRIKLLGEIRSLYIELLYETGRLAEEPELNQLSNANRKIGA